MRPISTLIILTLIFAAAGSAQTPKRQPARQNARDDEQLQESLKRSRAIEFVTLTAAEAPLWTNTRAAVEVLADASDLLWEQDAVQSAGWLVKAWNLIEQVPNAPQNAALKEFFSASDKAGLRTTVLSIARKRDPGLAERFLTQLADNKTEATAGRGAFDDRTARSQQLLTMAQQAVESNPDLAFALADRSLSEGISYSLQNVLTSLRRKNVGLANRLFDTALARIAVNAPDPSEAEVLAGYLFQSGFTFSVSSSGQTIMVVNPTQQNLPAVATAEPDRAKQFLSVVYRSLLATPLNVDSPENKQRAQRIFVLANRLIPHYYTFAADLAQPALGFLAQLRNQLSSAEESASTSVPPRKTPANETKTKKLSAEEFYDEHLSSLEAKADNEPNPVAKKLAYIDAALATKAEDYKRGKRVADKCPDDELRADTVAFLLYRAALFFVEKGEIDRASEIAPEIRDVSRRAVVQLAIAENLLRARVETSQTGQFNQDQQRAFNLITDLNQDLTKAEPSANMVKILLAQVALLATLDKAQALPFLEQAVQMINKLETYDLRDGSAPDLGLGIASASGATVARPRIGFSFSSAIKPVVVTDFEHISALVERFTAKEMNGVGRLELAKLFLSNRGQIKKELVSAGRN